MRLFLIQIGLILLISSCQDQNQEQSNTNNSRIHKVVLQEVIQTSSYTYLRVKENDMDNWLAVPKMQAEIGGTYYYEGGMEMKDFHSKELGRNFESVFFLEKVATSPADTKNVAQATTYTSTVKSTVVRNEVKIDPAEGGITISELFSSKEKIAGKTVKIRGQVTKYNAAIMKKNWIHLQDGTDYNGKFDLVVTSNQEFKVGDIVTIEGKVVLDRDFGYGYSYEILIEEAVAK
ncbi:MAG: OB-fold nucleic acid binding domain-containing protein [Bacteroidota bacterium]